MANTSTSTPRALVEYRALDASGKAAYTPSGKPGADKVRELQKLAQFLVDARKDPQERKDLLRAYGKNPPLVRSRVMLRNAASRVALPLNGRTRCHRSSL